MKENKGEQPEQERDAGLIAQWVINNRYPKEGEDFQQDLKEFDACFDHLYKMQGVKDAGHSWIEFTDKWNAFKKKLLSKENEGKQAVWIKASERFPNDPEEKCFRRKIYGRYQYLQTEDFYDEHLIFYSEEIYYNQLEWLDESVTIDSFRVKEAGERMKLVGEVERLKGLLRKEVEQTGGSWITYSKINNL